jgi:LEA14-like dessication related protein
LIIGARRAVLIAAIAAVALTIILYPLIVFTPFDPQKVFFELSKVELISGSQDEQKLVLQPSLNITNANDITLTTSTIDYELFADGVSVGTDTISYEDVPPNGRPALFPNQSVIIRDTDGLTLQYTDTQADLFNKVLNNSVDIKWSIKGSASVESGTTIQETQFSDSLD